MNLPTKLRFICDTLTKNMVQDDYFSADEMPIQDRMNFQLIFATAIFHVFFKESLWYGQNSYAGFDM